MSTKTSCTCAGQGICEWCDTQVTLAEIVERARAEGYEQAKEQAAGIAREVNRRAATSGSKLRTQEFEDAIRAMEPKP